MGRTDTTHDTTTTTTDDLSRAHAIAARARCDVRTALRAILLGPAVIRPRVVREAVARAIRDLGWA